MSFGAIGLLGMNRRNADFILPRNARKFYPLVDDKLKTKQLLMEHRLPSPELYFSISHNFELRLLREIKFVKEFVIKPARGAEGRGIVVIEGKSGNKWRKSSGGLLSIEEIEYHVANILAGLYSISGLDDQAIIEYRVKTHLGFRSVAFQGVPDIRLVLYRGVPAMAMLRLPTKESDGRANLHQGAVGTGIDMISGVTTGGVLKNRLIDVHPDTHVPVSGIQVPFWAKILETATQCFDVFKLGYIGVDFVVDQALGPQILELNARPGLNIQLANREGLLKRLNLIDQYGNNIEQLPWDARILVMKEVAARARAVQTKGD